MNRHTIYARVFCFLAISAFATSTFAGVKLEDGANFGDGGSGSGCIGDTSNTGESEISFDFTDEDGEPDGSMSFTANPVTRVKRGIVTTTYTNPDNPVESVLTITHNSHTQYIAKNGDNIVVGETDFGGCNANGQPHQIDQAIHGS